MDYSFALRVSLHFSANQKVTGGLKLTEEEIPLVCRTLSP